MENATTMQDRIVKTILFVFSLLLVGFHIYTAAFGSVVTQLQRSFHLLLTGSMAFLLYPIAGKKKRVQWIDFLFFIAAVVAFGYIALQYDRIALRKSMTSYLSPLDLVMGGLVIVLLLEIARRAVGIVMSLIAVVGLVYAFFGPYMPGMLAHRGVSLRGIIDYQTWGLDGVYSIPLSISATYIVLFVILGTLLEYIKSGDTIMDLGKMATGKYRGGPAKVACITSALFGSISGSAAANVYATGSFTIPMMKRIGYDKKTAGAIEAVASTGGQLMPPVMGAAAFLMAELIGVPYIEICKIALMPAIFFYVGLLFVLDFEAAKLGLSGLPQSELPLFRNIAKKLYLLLPIVALVLFLVIGYTPYKASFYAILISAVLALVNSDVKLDRKMIYDIIVTCGKRTAMIAIACAAAGIIIGVITLTGLGLSLSSLILSLSGGHLVPALLLLMLTCIIMGTGTPTTVAYILVATLGVPVMVDLGLPLMASHLFVFYFAVISMVTPPVAIAAFAAAEIADEDPIKVGFTSMRIAVIIYVIPFIFLFDPAMLLQAPLLTSIYRFIALTAGIVMVSGAFTRWFFRKLRLHEEVALGAVGIAGLIPNLYLNIVCVAILLVIVLLQRIANRKRMSGGATSNQK
ncbi:MAG: TRAP transporter fused permease subunit [Clostridia bacterium]|nr:TRAP transporter fused permease subunit [Clostridia bacterium]